MNRKIGELIRQQLSTLSFIDRLAGIVRPYKRVRKDVTSKEVYQTYPVSCDIPDSGCDDVFLKDLIPSGKYRCMVYLEDEGVSIVSSNGLDKKWQSNIKLICWLDVRKFETSDCTIASLVAQSISYAITDKPYHDGAFNSIMHEVVSQPSSTPSLFSKYTYSEYKSEYLNYPYEYFALNIKTTFQTRKSCIDQIITKDPLCL